MVSAQADFVRIRPSLQATYSWPPQILSITCSEIALLTLTVGCLSAQDVGAVISSALCGCIFTCYTVQLCPSVAVNILKHKPAELCQQCMHCAGNRAHAEQISGDPMEAASHLSDDSNDAFISTYVLDILSDKDIDAVLRLAHR